MTRISKKVLREIRLVSVFETVLRDRFESNNGVFFDNAPDMWSKEEAEVFDMVTEVEDKLKDAILNILDPNSKVKVPAPPPVTQLPTPEPLPRDPATEGK